jgi:hypothetical protein
MTQPSDSLDPAVLDTARRLLMGFRTTQLIHIAAKLALADRLKEGPQDVATLAAGTGAHPGALYRLLRALASMGIFAETAERRFELTALAQTLRSDVNGSLRNLAVLYGEEWLWSAYGKASYSVMTGLPAFERAHGQSFFEYLQAHPEAAVSFDRGMSAYSEQEAAAVLESYDLSGVTRLVDVGGGHGALLAAILRRYPQLHGVLFEQSSVIDHAVDLMSRAGLSQRCTLVAGDFFDSIPADGDVYLLKSVMHNWDDEHSRAILTNCRRAMHRESRLLIIDRVVPEGNAAAEAKLFDINMLVVLGGLERTAAQYRDILQQADFELLRVIATQAPVSIVEASPRKG